MTPIALSFSDGSNGLCNLQNKRGAWSTEIPGFVSVRKSDDALKYDCETKDGRRAVGAIESEMGGKIIASAIFLDFGITDAITDEHRNYATSFEIPIRKVDEPVAEAPEAADPVAESPESVGDSSAEGDSRHDRVKGWRISSAAPSRGASPSPTTGLAATGAWGTDPSFPCAPRGRRCARSWPGPG